MDNVGKGMMAGFLASLALAVLILIQQAFDWWPQLDFIMMQAQALNQYFGIPETGVAGWIFHFVIGTALWGGLFGACNHLVPGDTELGKGLWFSVITWIIVMVIAMPMQGNDLFGLNLGASAPIVSLIYHLVFGALLGYCYAKLLDIDPMDATMSIGPRRA